MGTVVKGSGLRSLLEISGNTETPEIDVARCEAVAELARAVGACARALSDMGHTITVSGCEFSGGSIEAPVRKRRK